MYKFASTILPAALALTGAVASATTTHSPAAPSVHVLASSLNQPKHLSVGPDGTLYVTLSGNGGAGTSDCVSGPRTEGPGTTQYCAGSTGAVLRLTGTRRTLFAGLPSVVERDTGEASGPADVAFSGGVTAIVFQDALVRADGSSAVPAPARAAFGTLRLIGQHSTRSVNLARFAALHPQNHATFGGTPGETAYDSDPYSVVAYRGGFAVTDAAANALEWVQQNGSISLLARFPTAAEHVPAGVLGPKAMTVHAQAVPTSVAVGPDGALYIGILRGVPSLPGTAAIYRVVPGHAPAVFASGLTAVTAIAFDGRRLLATELSTGGLLAAGKQPGALVAVSDGHVMTLDVPGLESPTGVAVGHDGVVYVSNNGTGAAGSAHSGEVLAIQGA